jgi:hypothetical protein
LLAKKTSWILKVDESWDAIVAMFQNCICNILTLGICLSLEAMLGLRFIEALGTIVVVSFFAFEELKLGEDA